MVIGETALGLRDVARVVYEREPIEISADAAARGISGRMTLMPPATAERFNGKLPATLSRETVQAGLLVLFGLSIFIADVFTSGTVSVRNEGAAKARAITELYPDHAAMLEAVNTNPQLNAHVHKMLAIKQSIESFETPRQERRRERRERRANGTQN